MKTFYGVTFMNKEKLKEVGVFHPIKLEYYKLREEVKYNNSEVYGIEIVKTEYIGENVKVEKAIKEKIIFDEENTDNILDLLKNGEVTPISLEDIVDDILISKDEL